MGEQTPAAGESQPQPQPALQLELSPALPPLPPPPSVSANVVAPTPSKKIPIRPQKMRKLSANPSPTIATEPSPDAAVFTPPAATTTPKNVRKRGAGQAARVLPQAIKPLTAEGEIDAAIRHLRSADPLLSSLIDTYPAPEFDTNQSPFLALAKSIIYQQLACKAGTVIYNRFIALCGGEKAVLPENVLALSAYQLKQAGISDRKSSYLYDLANKYKSGILSDESVVKMDDRSLFTMLSMVKGIGSWSVHMFMISSLHRPDVLPVSDLGVRKGVQFLNEMDELPRPSQMEQLCEKWKPYRSVGAWYVRQFGEAKGSLNAVTVPAMEGVTNAQPLQEVSADQEQHKLQEVSVDLEQHQLQEVSVDLEPHQLQLLEHVKGNDGDGAWSNDDNKR